MTSKKVVAMSVQEETHNDIKKHKATIKLFDKERQEMVVFTRDFEKHPYVMGDALQAMILEAAQTKFQKKTNPSVDDMNKSLTAIAAFTSAFFDSQFTIEEARGMDPIYSDRVVAWQQRALGMDIPDEETEDQEEKN